MDVVLAFEAAEAFPPVLWDLPVRCFPAFPEFVAKKAYVQKQLNITSLIV
jgi:hypothetical protein